MSHFTNLNRGGEAGGCLVVRGERLPGAGDEGGHMLTGRPTLGTEERPAPPSLSFVWPPGSWPGLVREQTGGLTDMAGLQSAVLGGD